VDNRSRREKYYALDRIKVYTGIFMADDIIINTEDPVISLGMSIEQAENLIKDLQEATITARKLREELYAYMENEKSNNDLLERLLTEDL
jgi:hypothetical protein